MNGGAEWVSGREVAFNEGCTIKEDNLFDKHLNKSSSYIVDLFFKLFFIDVLFHPENYFYFPSYFQEVSLRLPFLPSSFSEVNAAKWFYPSDGNTLSIYDMVLRNTVFYDNSYSTMPILPDNIARWIAVREELLWSEIIPDIMSELVINNEQARSLNVLAEIFGTHRSQHPAYGSLYDVFTEYLRSYDNARALLTNARNEWESLRTLLDHNGNLMEEAGFLDESSSNESGSGSNESGSGSNESGFGSIDV